MRASPSFFQSKKKSNEYQKLLEIEKDIVREVSQGDKHYLRKSANRKAQNQRGVSFLPTGPMCALRSAEFLTQCFYHLKQPHAQSLFSISNSFWHQSF